MFDIRCVYCKHLDKAEGCKMGLDDENCNSFEEAVSPLTIEDKPSCETCAWQSNGYCDFDLEGSLDCRRYKSLKEEL